MYGNWEMINGVLYMKMPCMVDDTPVFYLSTRYEKQGNKKVAIDFVDKGLVDHITVGGGGYPVVTVCNGDNWWTDFEYADFGDIVFFDRHEADKALTAPKKGGV